MNIKSNQTFFADDTIFFSVLILKQINERLPYYLPSKTRDHIYKTLVRPYFDYCDVIHHLSPLDNLFNHMSLNYLMERIEKVQYQPALAKSMAGL